MNLEKYVDMILEAMVAHAPLSLPMAERYKATENGIPAAVRHMTCFRTIVGIKCIGHIAVDRVQNSVAAVAEVNEGSDATTLLNMRAKIEDEKISELELFLNRSRAQAGFWFEPFGLEDLPAGWTMDIPANEKASREELYNLGKALVDDNIKTEYFCADETYLMENGSPVREHIDYLMGTMFEGAPAPDPSAFPPSGRMATVMPMLFGGRPTDLKNRIFAIDEERGIVVAYGTTPGFVSPYIVSDEISTVFAPKEMIDMHRRSLNEENMKDKSLLTEMEAVGMVTTYVRYFGGKIHGFHQIIVVAGKGFQCPWEEFYDYDNEKSII